MQIVVLNICTFNKIKDEEFVVLMSFEFNPPDRLRRDSKKACKGRT